MGILDEIEAEQRRKPDPWSGAEDKLEEWIGILPDGTMRPKQPKAPRDEGEMRVILKLCNQVTDVYTPRDFKNAVDYARAIKLHASRVPSGYAAGFLLEVELGQVYHKRRVALPVRDKKEAFLSPDFALAFAEAVKAVVNFGP